MAGIFGRNDVYRQLDPAEKAIEVFREEAHPNVSFRPLPERTLTASLCQHGLALHLGFEKPPQYFDFCQ